MFSNILAATMRFFDTNPSGRILNRFSKDMGVVDEVLPRMYLDSIQVPILSLRVGLDERNFVLHDVENWVPISIALCLWRCSCTTRIFVINICILFSSKRLNNSWKTFIGVW